MLSLFTPSHSTHVVLTSLRPTSPFDFVADKRDSSRDSNRRSATSMEHKQLMAPAQVSDGGHYSEITEDADAYLEPRSTHAPYASIDDAHDLSVFEGSVCDTDYFDKMCSPSRSATIDVDKYKIKPLPPPPSQPTTVDTQRMSAALVEHEAPFDESDVERHNGKAYRLYDRDARQLTSHDAQSEVEDDVISALPEDSDDDTGRPLSWASDCLNDLGQTAPHRHDVTRMSGRNINPGDVTRASSSSSQNGSDITLEDTTLEAKAKPSTSSVA